MSKNGIEKALGIGERLREEDAENNGLSEDERRERAETRKKEVAKIKAEIGKLKNNPDEDFVKEGLRELAGIGLQSMRILQDEIEVDPSGRAVECMAAMSNAVGKALKDLQNVELDKKKMELEEEKVNVKKNTALPAGKTVNNVLVTGSVTDLLRAMKDGSFENQDDVDVEALKEVEHEENKETGKSPFKKGNE